MEPTAKAKTLIEALPYLQAFRGKTLLIKLGGSAMEDPSLVSRVMRDIVFLELAGIYPVVVHGGGKAISAAMEAAGLEAKFVGGFRVTTEAAIDIVARVLSEEINPSLVQMICACGGKAVGIPGDNVFVGVKVKGTDSAGNRVDIGRVGEVVGCQLSNITAAQQAGMIPVISPLAVELATGKQLNINADLAAAALAKELKVAKLIYLSDVPGILEDMNDSGSLIKSVTGASTTRALSARHVTAVRPTGVVTHVTVALCVAADAANTAGDSTWPATFTDWPRCFTTDHFPFDFSSVKVANATDAAQLRGWTSKAPLIVESTSSACEWPNTTRSMPSISRGTRAATFSDGNPVATVS